MGVANVVVKILNSDGNPVSIHDFILLGEGRGRGRSEEGVILRATYIYHLVFIHSPPILQDTRTHSPLQGLHLIKKSYKEGCTMGKRKGGGGARREEGGRGRRGKKGRGRERKEGQEGKREGEEGGARREEGGKRQEGRVYKWIFLSPFPSDDVPLPPHPLSNGDPFPHLSCAVSCG